MYSYGAVKMADCKYIKTRFGVTAPHFELEQFQILKSHHFEIKDGKTGSRVLNIKFPHEQYCIDIYYYYYYYG